MILLQKNIQLRELIVTGKQSIEKVAINIGAPFIFSFRLLATGTGAGGKNVVGDADGIVYWMGKNRFFKYDGVIRELPCSVQYFVFNRMQEDYIDKTVIGHNRKFKEVTWFYVSTSNTAGTTNPEPDSYVTYNLLAFY